MAAELLTVAEVSAAMERSGVSGFSDAEIQTAIDRATDRIRQAALNDYTAASFESLTTSNAPDDMLENAVALALAILTRSDAARPERITAENDAAVRWLGFLAGGTTHYDQSPDAVLVKHGSGARRVSHTSRRSRLFDSDDTASDFSVRQESI